MEEKKMEEEFDLKRQEFLKYFTKVRKINSAIVIGIMLAYLVILLIYGGQKWVLLVGLIVILGLAAYNAIFKKRRDARLKNYIDSFYHDITDYAWNEVGISQYEEDLISKLAQEDVEKAGVYLDIGQLKTMNLVRFQLGDQSFLSADSLIKIKEGEEGKKKKNLRVAFAGKFYQSELTNLSINGNVLLYKKGKYDILVPPTDLRDLEIVEETNEYVFYASGKIDAHVKSVLLSEWKKVVIDECTLDATLTFRENRFTVLFSYADKMLTIPLYDKFENMGFFAVARDLKWLKETVEKLENTTK